MRFLDECVASTARVVSRSWKAVECRLEHGTGNLLTPL